MLRIFLELRFLGYILACQRSENNRISLFRAIQFTKYNLWTRTVDYGLAQLSVRAGHEKERLGKSQRRRQRKLHLTIISRLLNNIMRAKCVPVMLE